MDQQENTKIIKIKLTNIQDVKDFIGTTSLLPIEAEVKSGKYNVDAKSLLGLLSLNLSKPVDLILKCTEESSSQRRENIQKSIELYLDSIQKYIV